MALQGCIGRREVGGLDVVGERESANYLMRGLGHPVVLITEGGKGNISIVIYTVAGGSLVRAAGRTDRLWHSVRTQLDGSWLRVDLNGPVIRGALVIRIVVHVHVHIRRKSHRANRPIFKCIIMKPVQISRVGYYPVTLIIRVFLCLSVGERSS